MSYHYHHHHNGATRNGDEDNQRFCRGSRYAGNDERYGTASHRKRRSSGVSSPVARKSARYEPDPGGDTSGASDFERMARRMLAGTLVEPGDVSAGSSFSSSPPPPPPPPPWEPDIYPVFGKPIPRPAPPVVFGEMYPSPSQSRTEKAPPVVDLCQESETSGRLTHPVVSDLQRTEEETAARAEAALSVTDENPSRVLQLDRFVSREQLSTFYQLAFVLPCSHQVCRGGSCYHLPVTRDPTSTGQTVLEFTSEAKAAIFKRFLSSRGVQSQFVASSRSSQNVKLTSLVVREEFRLGIPKRTTMETYCVCTVVLHCLSSSSVETGLVSAPIKISLSTGYDCVTRPVIPLQLTQWSPSLGDKIGLTQQGTSLHLRGRFLMDTLASDPNYFLTQMKESFASLLKQNNPDNLYDKIILVFKTWQQADTFLHWVKLADYQNQLMSLVQLVGVIPEYSETPPITLFNKTFGWKIPKTEVGVQEECLAFHSVIMSGLSKNKVPPHVSIQDIVNSSISIKQALGEGVPQDKLSFGTRICFLSLDYFNLNGQFQLVQMGANILHTNSKKGENSPSYTATVLPSISEEESFLMSELGFSRNNVTGKIEYHDLDQMTSYEVVSEIQALLDLFEFLSSRGCRNSILLSYSSTTTLPVLLQLLERHGLDWMLYRMFSAYCDVQSLLENLRPGNEYFSSGVPSLPQLATELGITGLPSRPAAGPGAKLLSQIFSKLFDVNNIKGKELIARVRKCSEPISGLKFHPHSGCLPLSPLKKEFIWPTEQKLVELRTNFPSSDVNLADLIIVLHSEVVTGSDKLRLVSTSISKNNISAVIKNVSSNHFLLNPASTLAHLTLRPSLRNIPRVLPSLEQEGRRKYSSLEGLGGTNKCGPVEAAGSLAVADNILYDVMTNLTEEIKQSTDNEIFKITPNTNFQFPRGSSHKFDLHSVSLRCLQRKGSIQDPIPVQVNVTSLWQKKKSLSVLILPWDPTFYPPEDFLCPTCLITRGLHFPESCPALERCGECGEAGPDHSRYSCHNTDFCWNCGQSHYWKTCRKPILNRQQLELQKLGFVFAVKSGKLEVTFREDKSDREQEVISRKEAFLKIRNVLGVDDCNFQGSYLVSYNIFLVMDILMDMAESSGLAQEAKQFFSKIRGLIDVSWLFPETAWKQSLWSLCKSIDRRSVRPATSELKYVDRALQEILKSELNLSLFEDIFLICKNYSVKTKQSDLKRRMKQRMVPFQCLFKKVKTVSSVEDAVEQDEDDEDDSEGMMNSYVKFKPKPGKWNVTPAYLQGRADFILALKSFEVGGKKYLHSLSLATAQGEMLVNQEVIVPRDLYHRVPETDSRACTRCVGLKVSRPVLHTAEDCPGEELCTIHPDQASPHKKISCQEKRCWNCGDYHNWRNCEEPILTQIQHFFSAVGYKDAGISEDGERSFSFSVDVGDVEMKVPCVREDYVLARLVNVLEKSFNAHKSNVLVGYNIAEQLTDLLECCESISGVGDHLKNYIQAMVDIQWTNETQKLSLKQLVRHKCGTMSVNLSQTKNVVKWVSNILLKDEMPRVCLKFTRNLAKALTHKKPIIEIKKSSKVEKANISFSKTFLAFIYLEHENYKIKTLEILVKSWKKKTALFFHQREHSKPIDDAEIQKVLQDMMAALDQRGKGCLLTAVTLCPEGLEVFKINLERLTTFKMKNVFDGWICLAAEFDILKQSQTNLFLHCVEYDVQMITRLYDSFINIEKKSEEGLLKTTKMMQLLEHIVNIRGGETLNGRKIKTEEEGLQGSIYVFFDIGFKDLKFNDEYRCPFIKEIFFKFENEPVKVAEKTGIFLERLLAKKKTVVCVGLDDKSIAGLLQIAFWNTEIIDKKVVGVTTLKEVISVKRPSFKGSIEDILSEHGDVIDDKCKVKYLEAAFLQNLSSDRGSVIHPLYSPYINRIMISSALPLFSKHFVRVGLSDQRETSGGRKIVKAELLESLWNMDDTDNDMKLEIFTLKDLTGLIIPGQSSMIKKGEPVNVVMMNSKSISRKAPSGLVYGFINLIPKPPKEEPEFLSFKESFRSRFPLCPPAVLREIVESFKSSGIKNYDKALQDILDQSKNVQSLQRNLHTFLTNDFLSPSLIMEVMLRALYDKFVSCQPQKEKYPAYQTILAKKFPENWTVKTELDGKKLEYKFYVEKIQTSRFDEAELIEIVDDE